MKRVFAVLLALALAGCAESGNFDREKPIKLAVPAEPILPPTQQVPPKPPLAQVEASKAETNQRINNSSLMDCESEACRIQCSPGFEQGSRPKLCNYFKEPIYRHASEIQGKNIEYIFGLADVVRQVTIFTYYQSGHSSVRFECPLASYKKNA